MSLVAYGQQNMLIRSNQSSEVTEIPVNFTQQITSTPVRTSTVILRQGDAVKLKDIVFKSHSIETIDEFKSMIGKSTFKIRVGGEIIAEYNFSLLMELDEVKKYDDNYVVSIPTDFT